MTNQRRLGRGLEALLGRPVDSAVGQDHPDSDSQHSGDTATSDRLTDLSVHDVDANCFQPRQDFDEAQLNELAESLAQHGLLQPIVVRRSGERFELISGERRLRAAIKAGWSTVPAQIRQADDRQVAELAIVENLQRKDLSPLEKAASFQDYLNRYGCTQDELAQRIQVVRSTVANLLRLLELPAEVQQSLRKEFITPGHARALLPLGEEREQIEFCDRVIREHLSVRDTEELVQQSIIQADRPALSVAENSPSQPAEPVAPRPRSQHLLSLEQQFRAHLGTKVDLRTTAKGRGKIVIHFTSEGEFERIRQLLSGDSQGQPHSEAG